LTSSTTLASKREVLNLVARQSSDAQLKIYVAAVRAVLASAAVQYMKDSVTIELPLDRVPYSALIAYCRRRIGR
jgi:hypothetical protein